jgi:hypothetical protein
MKYTARRMQRLTNADDLLVTFGPNYLASLGREVFMLLDVEGNPNLSEAYYIGWAQTLMSYSASQTNGEVTILPCVYGTRSDTPTWSAVVGAISNGAVCKGAWIARWPSSGCQPLPDWHVVRQPPLNKPVESKEGRGDAYRPRSRI